MTSVAVYDAETATASFRQQPVRIRTDALFELIQDCLRDQHCKIDQIQGVVCGAGPGSFTGLRMACATAKGLCFSRDIPLVMVSSLQTLAFPFVRQQPVMSCIPTIRGQVYAQFFPQEGIRSPLTVAESLLVPGLWPLDKLASMVGASVAWVGPFALPQSVGGGQVLFEHVHAFPHPVDLARIGADQFLQHGATPLEMALPLYVMGSYAEPLLSG